MAQERKLDIITNNLANVNTSGYRKDYLTFQAERARLNFADVWQAQLQGVEEQGIDTSNPGLYYVRQRGSAMDTTPGALTQTGNPLDFALKEVDSDLQGRAFFAIETPNGVMYTRSRHFGLGGPDKRQLVHLGSGFPVLAANGGTIDLTSPDVQVTTDGTIKDTKNDVTLGRLMVVGIENPSTMQKQGNGLYSNAGQGVEDLDVGTDVEIRQFFKEGSNVNVIDELTKMIRLQRTFDTMARSIRTYDEAQSQLIGMAMRP
jgi:flagellar basal-body rod protein FlgG